MGRNPADDIAPPGASSRAKTASCACIQPPCRAAEIANEFNDVTLDDETGKGLPLAPLVPVGAAPPKSAKNASWAGKFRDLPICSAVAGEVPVPFAAEKIMTGALFVSGEEAAVVLLGSSRRTTAYRRATENSGLPVFGKAI